MRKYLFLLFLPCISYGQYIKGHTPLGVDSLSISYLEATQTNLIVRGTVANDGLVMPVDESPAGTPGSRTIMIRFKQLNGDSLVSTGRYMFRVWASTTEFGTHGKIGLVTIGNLTSGTRVYSSYAQNWNIENTLDWVMTDANGYISFVMSSTGNSGGSNQWIMIEIQGRVYSFGYSMYDATV